jgi:hypothetical protein
MAIFDSLQAFQFGEFLFPFRSYSIKGGMREHLHEFPHGGIAPEKLGRKLYEISVTGLFLEPEALLPAQRAR